MVLRYIIAGWSTPTLSSLSVLTQQFITFAVFKMMCCFMTQPACVAIQCYNTFISKRRGSIYWNLPSSFQVLRCCHLGVHFSGTKLNWHSSKHCVFVVVIMVLFFMEHLGHCDFERKVKKKIMRKKVIIVSSKILTFWEKCNILRNSRLT